MPFEKGHKKQFGRKKGSKDKKVLIKQALGISNIEDLKEKVLQNWFEFIEDGNKQIRLIATKEISKYLWATKKEVNMGLNESELELLRQAAVEQMKNKI
jgi:hypothetical protein